MLRLRITEHFDELRAAFDLFTETKISQNVAFERFWNSRRESQLEAINKIEQAGLARADQLLLTTREPFEESESETLLAQALTDYCFPLERGDLMYLATVNKYVDQKQVDKLRQFMKLDFMKTYFYSDQEYVSFLDGQEKAFDEGAIEFKTTVFDQINNLLTAETTVVDMSWWFNLDYHFDEVEITIFTFHSDFEAFTCPWSIRSLELIFDFVGASQDETNKLKHMEVIQNRFDQVDSIVIKLDFTISSDDYDQFNARIVPLIGSVKWDQRTTPVIGFSKQNELDFFKQNRETSNHVVGLYKQLTKISLADFDLFSQINWGHLFEMSIVLDGCSEQTLSKQLDMSSLCALKSLELHSQETIKDIEQWGFLDPIRAKLESFLIAFDTVDRISWKTFRGMNNLKRLTCRCHLAKQLDLDEHGHLFADLVQLKSLRIQFDDSCVNNEWYCELPSLEHLDMDLFRDYEQEDSSTSNTEAQITFKLPNLKSMKLDGSDMLPQSKDLTRSFSSLSHVDELHTPGNYLPTGWFKGFRCSKLVVYDYGPKNSVHLAEMSQLKSIDFKNSSGHWSILGDPLPTVTKIKLHLVDPEWLEANKNKFNTLPALENIHLNSGSYFIPAIHIKKSQYPVYFEQMDKFIMVHFY